MFEQCEHMLVPVCVSGWMYLVFEGVDQQVREKLGKGCERPPRQNKVTVQRNRSTSRTAGGFKQQTEQGPQWWVLLPPSSPSFLNLQAFLCALFSISICPPLSVHLALHLLLNVSAFHLLASLHLCVLIHTSVPIRKPIKCSVQLPSLLASRGLNKLCVCERERKRDASTYANTLTHAEKDSLLSGQRNTYQFSWHYSPEHVAVPECRTECCSFQSKYTCNEHNSCCNDAQNTLFICGPIERKLQAGYINLLCCVLQVCKSFKSLQLFWNPTSSHTIACLKKLCSTNQHIKNCL